MGASVPLVIEVASTAVAYGGKPSCSAASPIGVMITLKNAVSMLGEALLEE